MHLYNIKPLVLAWAVNHPTGNGMEWNGMEVLHKGCNMGTHGLPDMSTLCPWACGSDGHIRQTICTHVTTINYRPQQSIAES